MVPSLTVLVVGLTLLQSQSHCTGSGLSKFSFRLNFLSRNGNGEKLTAHGRSTLEDLKQDIIQACRSGELDEVKGYMGSSGELKIPTKVYFLPHETGNEVTHFLLPAVTCETGRGTQEDFGIGVNRRTETLVPERKKPLFVPRAQTLTDSQVRNSDWTQFPNRFSVISENAYENDGVPTSGGKQALESLKEDMTQACAAGDLKVVRPSTSQDLRGTLDSVRIPTKVYDFTSTPEPEQIVLPAVTCQQNVVQGTKIEKPQNQYDSVVRESMVDTRFGQTKGFVEKEDSMKSRLSKDTWEDREAKSKPTVTKGADIHGSKNFERAPSFNVDSATDSFIQHKQNDQGWKSIPEEVVPPAFSSQGNTFKSASERWKPQNQGDNVVRESVYNTGLKQAEDFRTVKDKEDIMKSSTNSRMESLNRDYGSESRRLDDVVSNSRSNSWGSNSWDSTSTKIEEYDNPSFNVDSAAASFIDKFHLRLKNQNQRAIQDGVEQY